MSVVETPSRRGRLELLERTLGEWQDERSTLVAKIDTLRASESAERTLELERAPTKRPGAVGSKAHELKRRREETEKDLERLDAAITEATRLVADLHEIRAADVVREHERRAAEFTRREEEAWQKVGDSFAATAGLLFDLYAICEERDEYAHAINPEHREMFTSVLATFPGDPGRAFEMLAEASWDPFNEGKTEAAWNHSGLVKFVPNLLAVYRRCRPINTQVSERAA